MGSSYQKEVLAARLRLPTRADHSSCCGSTHKPKWWGHNITFMFLSKETTHSHTCTQHSCYKLYPWRWPNHHQSKLYRAYFYFVIHTKFGCTVVKWTQKETTTQTSILFHCSSVHIIHQISSPLPTLLCLLYVLFRLPIATIVWSKELF